MARQKRQRVNNKATTRAESQEAALSEAHTSPSSLQRLLKAAPFFILSIAGVLTGVNAMLFQEGKHPAPLVETRKLQETRNILAEAAQLRQKQRQALVKDVQRELRRLGYYPGTVDGMSGPATERAVRAFERDQKQSETGRITEGLFAQLAMQIKRAEAGVVTALPKSPPARDVVSQQVTTQTPQGVSDSKIKAVQQVLANLGYGPLVVDGIAGSQTVSAVMQFERDRGLQPSGKLSKKLLQELEKISGERI